MISLPVEAAILDDPLIIKGDRSFYEFCVAGLGGRCSSDEFRFNEGYLD
jgi:hypothetical protein